MLAHQKKMNCRIQAYIDLVESGEIPVCKEQIQLIKRVINAFAVERIHIDETQLEKYLDLQKYFPYKLLEWEVFLFALHNCVYKENGQLRWPILFVMVGRGAGKNGYLAFEDFALLTPVNGVKNYDIDIFAMSEEQAKATFTDIYDMLEANKAKMKNHFSWNLEVIRNIKTNSRLRFRTSAPKTKDGGRPGKVDFDEYHAYENTKLIDVVITGLGKKTHPRRTYITTDGDVRDGPLDKMLEQCKQILDDGNIDDNGLLPFICRIENDKEIEDKSCWPKANPSYLSFPTLQHEMDIEFSEYLLDKIGHAAFATKRLNRPQGNKDAEVTSWDNILATNKPVPDMSGKPAVWGIDYASTQDFVAAGVLFKVDGAYYWITHTWICKQSKDLSRIRAPLAQWEAMGLLTFVDDVEIDPEIPVTWLVEQREKYHLVFGAIDHYRHTLMSKYLRDKQFDTDKKKGNVKLTYLPEQSMAAPIINRIFTKKQIVWGDNPLMRWYTNNAKQCVDSKGNITYGKIEPKSRKTDGFMALVAAIIVSEILDSYSAYGGGLPDVYEY
jgi:phage terminase large subunit-like protein